MVKFLKSASSARDWIVDKTPEFCFIGRSNVGKSTLINAMARTQIAKTSKTPGRTQLVNFFDFGKFRIVDLPGYGYARISKGKQFEIGEMINEYLNARENLKIIFQICDTNVITPLDLEMSEYFRTCGCGHYIILNKCDKQARGVMASNVQKAAKALRIDQSNIIPVSAKKATNLTAIFSLMNKNIKKD